MVSVRIQDKNGFNIIGVKTWIPGIDNNAFGEFWNRCHAEGKIGGIKTYAKKADASETHSEILGVSCTENDPNVRSFYFYVAVETEEREQKADYEIRFIKPYTWAIFSSEGHDIHALMECEMYAWKEWLPNNGKYLHDNGPELEVYFQENKIEYWVPVKEKEDVVC